jgi:pyruvate dehydrogenase E1 component alpha subunit
MGTSVKRISGVEDFAIKAEGCDLPGHVLNGMDFLDVYEGIKKIADETRKTNTACLIDIKTYRYKGHSISDPAKYRTKDELEQYKKQDPIVQLKLQMIEAKMLTEDEFKQMDDELKAEVQEAVDFADKSEEPALHTMYEDILA